MNNYVSKQPYFSRNLEFPYEMRTLKMMSHRARFGLILLGIAAHNFPTTLEITSEKKCSSRGAIGHPNLVSELEL